MTDHVESVVVGGGAVGLGIGRALARAGREVVVLEANPRIGSETSSRNNEIIHAGFLYRPGSLRARLAPAACGALYAYCAERGVPTANTGKLILAVEAKDLRLLETLAGYAEELGVGGVTLIGGEAARNLEPALRCRAAIHSERTGIVDSHALMLAYRGEIEDAGGAVAVNSRATGGRVTGQGFDVDVRLGHGSVYTISCKMLVNAAGLGAQRFAAALAGYPASRVPELHLGKGCYFSYSGTPPFSRHVTPIGEALRMGGAFTADLGGRLKFGPDFELVSEVDYTVDPARKARFVQAIRRYYPDVDSDRLTPDYAGIRPMLSAERNVQLDDWIVHGPADHGIAGLVHLFGISTPGLTASLVLGQYVKGLLD